MLDENNYPGKAALKQIAKWDIGKQGIDGLLDLVADNTNWADRQIYRGKRGCYEYHTGGWSGNEDVGFFIGESQLGVGTIILR